MQFVEPKIVVRLIDLQLVGFAVLIDREGHKTAREIVSDRRPPPDDERIVMPMLQVGDEIR